jgi:antitoxin (DNA-binding transcriptional repressor) of toxin-antitoxin stability system
MTTMSSREFNRDVSAAKRAAEDGPVIITDRGKPSHVLMAYDDYARRVDIARPIHLQLAMNEDEYFDYDFEVDRLVDTGREIPEL